MCGVLSACSDRYEDMEFKIYYAFSEDATDWYDASQGISLNYGGEEDLFQIDESTGVASIYLRVEIENVSDRYIDEIIVTKLGTSGGVNFSSAIVDQNEVFKVDITGNTNSSLRFYETNSGRQKDIDLSIYRSLDGIMVDTSIKPAVKVGDTISLMSIRNLYYLPLGNNGQTLTNQTGVNYTIASVGYYSEIVSGNQHEYVAVLDQNEAYSYMSLSQQGVLTINSNFSNLLSNTTYVVRIRAISMHNPDIAAEFDVYVVEDQEYTPFVYYTNDVTQTELGYEFTLYDNDNYSSVNLSVDLSDLPTTSIYSDPKNTIDLDGQIKYEISIYVDNIKVDLSELREINGLLIESLNADNTQFRITLTNRQNSTNTLRIALEITGLDFSASNAPEYSRTIMINKSILPENISINDVTPELTNLQGSMEGIIYSTNSSSYQGLELTLLAVPTVQNSDVSIYITANQYVNVSGPVTQTGTYTYMVRSGETVFISFRSNAQITSDQRIVISAQATPTTFENQGISERFIEITYTLRHVVTADSIEIYSDSELTQLINENMLYIDARNNTDAYVKVNYTGTSLDASSISLTSSNSDIRFLNNSDTILLNDPTVERVYTGLVDANNRKYDLFRVGFLPVATVDESTITITAGDDSVGVQTGFTASSVYILQEDSITVQSSSRDVTTFNDINNGHFNFAVVKNQLVQFDILGRVQGAVGLSDSGIVDFTISVNTDYGATYGGNNNFSTDAVSFNKLNTSFSLRGNTGFKTTVLTLEIYYYTYINDIITLTSTIVYVDVAVYDPIASINTTVSADEIAYINEYYEDAATSNITFSSYASNYSAASSQVVFSGLDGNEIVREDASQLRVEFNRDLNVENTIELYLLNGNEEIRITNNSILELNANNILSGTLRVRLNGATDFDSITLSLTALRFGESSNTAVSIIINFVEHEAVDGIRVSGDNIVQNGVDSYYIYMSFIDVPENGNTATSFTATPYYISNEPTGLRYDDLTYQLYQVQQDENGNIVVDENNQAVVQQVSNTRLNITIDQDTNLVTIRAYKNLAGGLFRLVLASMDSYDSSTGTYLTTFTLFVSISDGTIQNKYIISSVQDLYNINNDLNANYVLRSNITVTDNVVDGQAYLPIGGESAFNGTLSGTVQNLNSDNEIISSRYKITIDVNNTVTITDGSGTGTVYAGLFARLGSDAVISDLDIDATFNTSQFTSTSSGGLYIGAIAGANEGGRIAGVNVVLIGGSDITFNSNNISTNINFGGMVGSNLGYIDLESGSISCDATISINTYVGRQHNIGLVAGRNTGEIFGAYLGKDSLNNVNYSVISNLVVNNLSSIAPTLYLGSIAGYNYGGYIHNVIVGGLLSVQDDANVANLQKIAGYIGGVAGYSDNNIGSSVSIKGIETVAVLGMDILGNNSNVNLAGIVGQSVGAIITDVRVLASKVDFTRGGLTTYGRISGNAIVAGIIANSTNYTEVFNASVESFISSTQTDSGYSTFYMLHSSINNVAGLIYSSSDTTLTNSFVSANINTNTITSALQTIYLTSNATELNVYYIGRLNNIDSLINNILVRETNSGYYVVYTDNSIYNFNTDTGNYELNLSDYFDAQLINVYEEQPFLSSISVTSDTFETLKENLYVLVDGVYSKVADDDVFEDTNQYYEFDATLWQTIRQELYIAIGGYLEQLNDNNFNPNQTYYLVEDVDITDYYLRDENNDYILNVDDRIQLGAEYYNIMWKTETNPWEDTVKTWTGAWLIDDQTNWESSAWDIDSERNNISIYGLNFYFPYVVHTEIDGTPILDEGGNKIPLMIERPTDIQADINEDYIIEINSSFIDNDYIVDNYNVTSTTIINYHNDINNPLNNESYNTYNIVNTSSGTPDGLVDLQVIPSSAQGGVRFEIVRGSAYAYINSRNQIVFTGVSGSSPIVVRCYSLFNDELEEFVVFFTQFGLSDLILSSNSISEIEENDIRYELYTHTGANSSLVSIQAENIFNGREFSTILDAGLNNYLEVEAVSTSVDSVLNIVNANSTNGIMIEVANTEFDGNMVSEIVNFTLKLNLTEYFGESYYPSNDGVDQYLDLASSNLRVIVYKTATDVDIEGGDYSVFTNANINFNVNLYTGYVSGSESSNYVSYMTRGEYVILNEEDKDSITLSMEAVSNQEEINNLLKRAGVDNIVELFDFDFSYTLLRDQSNTLGYSYLVGLSLKDEFDFRYITSSIVLRLNVYGANNANISDSILITYNPTELSTVRIENYTATNVTNITNYVSLIESNTTETSVISPGGYGGVMMIYLEPSYSNILSATLTSSSLYVPSLGRNVSIIFEQLVRNEDGGYETIYPNNEIVDGGIRLKLASSVDSEGNYSYDGIIYIHTQMDRFVGMAGVVEATLNVTTGDNNQITQTRTLITEFLPGASLSYDGYSVSTDEFLIQRDTYNNEIDIQIYGYQFNSNPTISFVWKLNDSDTTYSYLKIDVTSEINEVNFYNRKSSLYTLVSGQYIPCSENSVYDPSAQYFEDNRNIIQDGTRSYNILDYLSYRFLDNYDQVIANADGSYTMTVLLNVSNDIPAGFEMFANLTLATSESLITSEQEDSLTFYPVDYLVSSVSSTNLTNGNMNIAYNRTSAIDLYFETNNPNRDLSEDIYNNLLEDIGVENLASLFYYINSNSQIVDFADPLEQHPEFTVNIVNGKLAITGNDSFYRTIQFSVHYAYVLENGQYVLRFGTMNNNSLTNTLEFSFVLNIYANTTEENAIPIYSVDDIFDPETGACLLGEDADYILMNDIVLENFVPIDVDIASLDGNNKVIKIRSFAVGVDQTEYGLFANIGTYQDVNGEIQTTILKNVIVDYSEFNNSLDLTNNSITNVTFGGLVANNNNGLIYNCDVLNLGTSTKTINILLDNSSDVTVVFGGLVGQNSGIITNSRVGRLGYTRITASEDYETSVQVSGNALNFVIGNSSGITTSGQGFVGITGGFVGRNSGTIATSYVANTGLMNYSTAPEGTGSSYSMTAGFVGENTSTGTISYSYVKALESTISETVPYSTGLEISSPTNGNVAGFVYLNSGHISNSFANTVLTSTSAYVAGFVYNNQADGVISESYAACTLNGVDTINDASEQPFVGVSNSDELLSYGSLDNVYYLIDQNNSFIVKTETGKDQAVGLNRDNFTDSNNLNGFVFIISNSRTERNQGVWSYYNQNNSYRILPELTNTNQIAHSYRYLLREENSEYIYTNATSYEQGSENNPYIIRSVEEFNSIMTSNGTTNSMSDYVRFINNIDFASDETAIQTRVNFTLGDIDNNSTTSIDGNGMTISGIYLDVGNAQEDSIGLFAEIENAYVKNLNLEFASTASTDGQFSSLSAIYSGGLAGRINNSVIININLDGQSTTISGQNFAGGLAGMITGTSLIYGIDSNLSVKAVNTDVNHYYMYYNEADFTTMRIYGAINYSGSYSSYLNQLSYAGGIAGVIDLESRDYVEYNLSYINIYGNEMYDKTSIDANILADYAGGVAGYAGKETTSLRLKYYVGTTNLIRGQFAVGGIFAVSTGDIVASQVTAEEDEQYVYDTTLGEYIIDLENGEDASLNVDNAGNLNLLETYRYGGGLIGIAINSEIDSSYSKASFKVGRTVGGLVGVSIASDIVYSYAVPYVNIDDTYLEKAGGLIGSAYGVRSGTISRNEEVSEYISYLSLVLGETNKTSDIQFTFSSLLLDIDEISTKNISTNDYINFDYVCADYGQNDGDSTGFLTSNNGSSLLYVFAGRVEAYDNILKTDGNDVGSPIVEHSNSNRANEEYISKLYDLSDENVEQLSTFNNIFSGWSTVYWSLNANRYFPLLLNENVENYIEIATPDDFYQLINNPNGSFIIVNDIDMTDWCNQNNTNFIFNIDFTGILIGETEDNDIPVLYNLSLNANYTGDAGLFRSTEGATIRNLTFEWGVNTNDNNNELSSSVILNNNIDTFGGVSASDTGSLFSNLTVRVVNGGNSLTDVSLFNSNNGTISGFGGIVGSAVNSNILNCTFSGRVDVSLNDTTTNSNIIYFGGLVGRSDRDDNYDVDTGESEDANMSIMNSNVGMNYDNSTNVERTVFNLNISDATNVYIGGAVGYATNTALSSISVGHYSYENNYRRIVFNINLDNCDSNNYFGGIAGNMVASQLSSSDAITEINVSGSEANTESTTNYINAFAGLVGRYSLAGSSSYLNINNSNTSANINYLDSTITNLYTSSGVAYIESGNGAEIVIRQSLFTGTITSELDSESGSSSINANLINVHAGGVAAYAQGCTLVLEEVMSTTDIILGSLQSTIQTYLGGLVGEVSTANNNGGIVQATNVASTGRIIPITSYNTDATRNLFYIGGFVGRADTVDFTNAYSLSSIILDSLTNSAIQALNVNALYGEASTINTEYVYYSSDYALVTENSDSENDGIYNLTAFTLARSNAWRTNRNHGFNSLNGVWTEIATTAGTYYLPYLISLNDDLINYGIMRQENNTYSYIISALNPTIIENSASMDITSSDVYTYYILSNNISESTTLSFGNGTLNGILIGGEIEYNSFAMSTASSGGNTYSGIIAHIGRHSAVSNLHIRLSSGTNYSFTNIAGIIAGLNEGAISNCSVQGTGLNIGASSLGLINGRNDGIVAYSYSTAEIVSAAGAAISGIVYQNGGKIMTCYFTGYINNMSQAGASTATAAGIVISNVTTGTQTDYNNFIYNTYMAGVIEIISDNSFIANTAGLQGFNNYIDSLSNVEGQIVIRAGSDDDATYEGPIILQTISTPQLMAADNLTGEWYTTTSMIDNYYYVDKNTDFDDNDNIYGYNYLYPAIKINKINTGSTDWDNNDYTYVDRNYLLYTGTGYLNTQSYTDVINVLGGENNPSLSEDYVKENIMRIPHLGVLSAIQSLALNYENNNGNVLIDGNEKLYYVLIYDIEGNNSWQAVGDNSGVANSNYSFYNGSSASFAGMFISNKYYDFSTLSLENACQITGLGSGIFTNIKDSYFAFLNLGGGDSAEMLSNSGLLGVTVNPLQEDVVTVNKIQIMQNTVISGNTSENNYVGGLFGNIILGTINIIDFVTSGTDTAGNTRTGLTFESGNTVGLIAGQLSGGTVNLSFTEDGLAAEENIGEQSGWYVRFDGVNRAGGLFGIVNSSDAVNVNATAQDGQENNTINISVAEGGISSLGGIVGVISGNSDISISNLSVLVNQTIENGQVIAIDVDIFGGLVAHLGDINSYAGRALFTNCGLILAEELSFASNAQDKYLGLLTAIGGSGTLAVDTFYLDSTTETEGSVIKYEYTGNLDSTYNSSNEENQGFGILAGKLQGASIIFDNTIEQLPTLRVINAYNTGGIVGVYSSGSIGIPINGNNYNVTVQGTTNVGGAIGLVTNGATLDNIIYTEQGDDTTSYWNFLNTTEGNYATLETYAEANSQEGNEGNSQVYNYYNWGGLFGYYKGANLTNVANKNSISIGTSSSNIYKNIYNVGGVAGQISNSTEISLLSNEGTIEPIQMAETMSDTWGLINEGNEYALDVSLLGTDVVNSVRTINVGGIFGYVEGSMVISNIINNSDTILGYQNVGGLIGYLGPNVEMDNSTMLTFESVSSQTSDQMYYYLEQDGNNTVYKLVRSDSTASSFYQLSENSVASTGSVVGAINVGGAFGYINGATVIGVCSSASVYGNASVGGFVGFIANSSTYISNSIVTNLQSDSATGTVSPVEVKGIYLSVAKTNSDTSGGTGMTEYEYYIPTSVGGFVGTALAGQLENNDVYNTNVTSTIEGNTEHNATESNNIVISTISNNMVTLGFETGTVEFPDDPLSAYEYYVYNRGEFESVTTYFEDMTSGFGGFIGSVHNAVAGQTSINTNNVQVNINAQLGVNVGAYYGYYYGTQVVTLDTPYLVGNVSINGSYNIGGVLGYYSGSSGPFSFTLSQVKGSGTITIQNAGNGMYVGGLFGKLENLEISINETSSQVNISMYTGNNFYIGGLVGKVVANGNLNFTGSQTRSIIPSGQNTTDEFGGLIGLLKVGSSGTMSGYTIRVEGSHNYPFTINTIENSNYADGNTDYSVNQSGTNVTLTAVATYINLDSFVISPTSDASWYSASAKNPTREDSWGWARDYTMFKTMQRCIPQSQNNGASWDAISQIYDAGNITYVGTILNLGLSNTQLYDSSGARTTLDPDYICYTIYEETEGKEKLYSAIGIAEPYINQQSGEYDTPVADTDTDSAGDYFTWFFAVLGFSSAPDSFYPLSINQTDGYQALTYLNYSDDARYQVVGLNRSEGFWPSQESGREYFCLINNYYRYDNDDSDAPKQPVATYFTFTYFYDNNSLQYQPENGTAVSGSGRNATSGSIFEVNGVLSNVYDQKLEQSYGNTAYPWLSKVQTAIDIALVAIAGAAGLFSSGIRAAGKAAVKAVAKAVVKVVKKIGIRNLITMAILATIVLVNVNASEYVDSVYYDIRNESIGFTAQSYMREVMYENNILQPKVDEYSTIEEVGYVYYSATRPNDYYESRYYVYYPDSSQTAGYSTAIVSADEIDFNVTAPSQIPDEFAEAMVCAYNGQTSYAYEYYKFQDGAYYVIMDAIETDLVPTQLPLSSSLREYNDYVQYNGFNFVRGNYNGSYTYSQNQGTIDNTLEYSNGIYTVNGKTFNHSFLSSVEHQESVTYYLDPNISGGDSNGVLTTGEFGETITYYYGYGYMKNAYYTANGRAIDGQENKVGTFIYDPNRSTSGLVEGIDFVTVIPFITQPTYDEEGNQTGETVVQGDPCYYFISSVTAGTTDNTGTSFTIDYAPSTGDSIQVNLYPYSFDDPYIDGAPSNSQDSKYYLIKEENDVSSQFGLTHTATYYYYEGGYITGQIGEDDYYAYTRILEIDSSGNVVAGSEINDINTASLIFYNASGETTTYSYINLINGIQNGSADLNSLYIEDTTTYSDMDATEYNNMCDILRVSNNYKVVNLGNGNRALYGLSSEVQIDEETGLLSGANVTMPNTDSAEYNYNKYAMNLTTEFYTRYKLDNVSLFFTETRWINSDGGASEYYIYVENQSSPNPGYTTNFVEGCRVFMSGQFYQEGTVMYSGSIQMLTDES